MAKPVFTYKVTTTIDDVVQGEPQLEKYTIGECSDNQIVMVPEGTGTVLVIRMDLLKKDHEDTFNGEPVDVFTTDLMGGGETVYFGKDHTVLVDIKTQMWSRGVIYTVTRELVSKTV